MTFHRHPTRRKRHGFRYVRWTTQDRRFAVEKSEWLGQAELPVIYRVLRRTEDGWRILSRHRTKRAAERAAVRWFRMAHA